MDPPFTLDEWMSALASVPLPDFPHRLQEYLNWLSEYCSGASTERTLCALDKYFGSDGLLERHFTHEIRLDLLSDLRQRAVNDRQGILKV